MHEIIHVVDPESPAGAAQQGLEIEAVDGRPLASGYYFVLWPCKTGVPGNRGKRYFGPFATRTEARLLQRSALTLGLLVEGETLAQSIVECRSIARPSAAAGKLSRIRSYAGSKCSTINWTLATPFHSLMSSR